MLRDIFQCSYIPSLCVRPAEMRALEELPESDKDTLFPYIMMSPWAGAKDMSASIKRIEKAYGSRTFILGIDRYYDHQNPTRTAQYAFLDILKGNEDFKQYRDFVSDVDQAIPVAFLVSDDYDSLKRQIEAGLKLGKGVVISVDKQRSIVDDRLGEAVKQLDPIEYAIHIDGGWSVNHLTDAIWYVGACRSIYKANEKAAVVISCASFPKGFADFDGVVAREIGSRSLFQEVSRHFNNEKLLYGDWASTKPRSYERGGSQPKPRIDYALKDKWIICRHWSSDNTDNWDYNDAAKQLIESEYWPGEISIWGEMRIQQTADALPFSIENAPGNVAARINIHLHQQTNFEKEAVSTDDPWTDDF